MPKPMLTPEEQKEASELSRFLMAQLREFPKYKAANRTDFDARIVGVACVGVAGSFMAGVSPKIKLEIGTAFAEGFITYAGLPLRVISR